MTHALDGIHLDDRLRRVRRDRGALGLRQVDAPVDPRPARHTDRRQVLAERPAGREPVGRRARPHAEPRDRLHLPELQPHRRPERLRERRTPADLHGYVPAERRKRVAGPRAGRHGTPGAAPARPAVGRSAAARRRGPRGRAPAVHPAGRRAHGQPRLAQRRTRDAAAARVSPRRATICMVTHDPRYAAHAGPGDPSVRRTHRPGAPGGDRRGRCRAWRRETCLGRAIQQERSYDRPCAFVAASPRARRRRPGRRRRGGTAAAQARGLRRRRRGLPGAVLASSKVATTTSP